jgi:hypothetical protein
MAANMLKNSLKNVESDNNKILYETLLDYVLQQNGTYFLNTPRIYIAEHSTCNYKTSRTVTLSLTANPFSTNTLSKTCQPPSKQQRMSLQYFFVIKEE